MFHSDIECDRCHVRRDRKGASTAWLHMDVQSYRLLDLCPECHTAFEAWLTGAPVTLVSLVRTVGS